MSYPAYPNMEPTESDWLGNIPPHWKQKRLKYAAQLVNEKLDSAPDKAAYVGMENIESGTGRVVPASVDLGEVVTETGACNVFARGDVLFGKLRPYLAKVIQTESSGVCSTELLVLRAKQTEARFLFYYLIADGFIKTVNSSTYGSKMPRASWDFIGDMPILLPPLPEQQVIAAFLDRKTTEIDRLLRLKEAQIALLEKKRQATISEAVTRGLDRTAQTKCTESSFARVLPVHWNFKKIKHIASKIGSGRTPSGGADVYVPEGVIFLRSQNVYDDGLRLSDVAYINEKTDKEMSDTRVMPGDVLLNITGASIGRTSIVPISFPSANVNQHVCIIRLHHKVSPEFISYCLKSALIKGQIQALETGSSREGLNFEQVANMIVAIPEGDINEQRSIVRYLDEQMVEVTTAVSLIQTQIEKLRAYRQSLISEAVTGKIDVRGVLQ